MAVYVLLGFISGLTLIVLMTLIVLAPLNKEKTPSQKILEHFEIKEDKCDLDEFVNFCKNNPVQYNYKNNQEE
jgi:hypothetical protein